MYDKPLLIVFTLVLAATLFMAGYWTCQRTRKTKREAENGCILPLGVEPGDVPEVWLKVGEEIETPYKIVCPFTRVTGNETLKTATMKDGEGRLWVSREAADAYIVAVCANFQHHINNAAQIVANRKYLDSESCEKALEDVAKRLKWLTRTFVPQVLDGNVAVGLRDHENSPRG